MGSFEKRERCSRRVGLSLQNVSKSFGFCFLNCNRLFVFSDALFVYILIEIFTFDIPRLKMLSYLVVMICFNQIYLNFVFGVNEIMSYLCF